MKESGRMFTSYDLKSWCSIMNGVLQLGFGATRSADYQCNVDNISAYTFFFFFKTSSGN